MLGAFISQVYKRTDYTDSGITISSKCPEESREAVASLMLAAARFADLPELRELRSLFTEKYGTSLENFVNKEVKITYQPPAHIWCFCDMNPFR